MSIILISFLNMIIKFKMKALEFLLTALSKEPVNLTQC